MRSSTDLGPGIFGACVGLEGGILLQIHSYCRVNMKFVQKASLLHRHKPIPLRGRCCKRSEYERGAHWQNL